MKKAFYYWCWAILVVWVLLVLTRVALCEPLTDVRSVDKAIVYILSKGVPKHNIKPYPEHMLLKSPYERLRLARAIVSAAKRHRVSRWILVATAFREGSFKGKKKGLGGELSMFQIMPGTARLIREFEPMCSFTTVESAAICAAAILRQGYDKCGSMSGALAKYVTGKGCKAVTARVKWIVWDRQGIARALEKMFSA